MVDSTHYTPLLPTAKASWKLLHSTAVFIDVNLHPVRLHSSPQINWQRWQVHSCFIVDRFNAPSPTNRKCSLQLFFFFSPQLGLSYLWTTLCPRLFDPLWAVRLRNGHFWFRPDWDVVFKRFWRFWSFNFSLCCFLFQFIATSEFSRPKWLMRCRFWMILTLLKFLVLASVEFIVNAGFTSWLFYYFKIDTQMLIYLNLSNVFRVLHRRRVYVILLGVLAWFDTGDSMLYECYIYS